MQNLDSHRTGTQVMRAVNWKWSWTALACLSTLAIALASPAAAQGGPSGTVNAPAPFGEPRMGLPAPAFDSAPSVVPKKADAQPSSTAAVPAPVEARQVRSKELSVILARGAHAEAVQRALVEPFARTAWLKVEAKPVAAADAAALLSGEANTWDVLETDAFRLDAACKEGRLVPGLPAEIGLDTGGDATGDFVDGALTNCGVAGSAWSVLFLVDQSAIEQPSARRSGKKRQRAKSRGEVTSLRDVFDTKRFPGKRALIDAPEHLLELATMSRGIKPADVYRELATDDGLAKTFAVLDAIAGDAVWVPGALEAEQLLASGDVAIAMTYSGRAFMTTAVKLNDYDLIWDGQILHFNAWAVNKAADDRKAAADFIRFAVAAERMAATAALFPYGPTRRSAFARPILHRPLGLDVTEYLPTAPRNMATALRFDGAFWSAGRASLTARYEEWRRSRDAREGGGGKR
jgi:putative spermidine/putrescine transport system substrate-binding protein